MPRRIIQKSALILGGLAVPLLLVEVTLRLFGSVLPGNYETAVWAEGHPVVATPISRALGPGCVNQNSPLTSASINPGCMVRS